MKTISPFGRQPFRFSYVEAQDGEVALMGTVAGVPSGVVFEGRDLAIVTGLLTIAAAVILLRRAS